MEMAIYNVQRLIIQFIVPMRFYYDLNPFNLFDPYLRNDGALMIADLPGTYATLILSPYNRWNE